MEKQRENRGIERRELPAPAVVLTRLPDAGALSDFVLSLERKVGERETSF